MRDVKNQEQEVVYDKLTLTDSEYLEWISGWLDRADADHDSIGLSPVFVGRAHIRRLLNLARKSNDER